jgi:myo-inositol-1(or 4)-monophosphatase
MDAQLTAALAPNFWQRVLDCAEQLTTQVGKRLLADFQPAQALLRQAEEKSDGSLVTRSDQWADQTLRAGIAETFPDHGLLSEEGTHTLPAGDWCWVIDPIDGTTNFARGIPIWAICLGLLYRGQPVFGYVYLPALNQAFHGFWQAPGQADSAFLNGQPITTRPDAPGGNQFFSLCARSIAVLKTPFPCKIRMLGATSYNFLIVAAGATLGGVEATPKVWDLVAVYPIVRAAGGSWVNLKGGEPFPLQPERDYGGVPYPTLVTARVELEELFQPLVAAGLGLA